MRKEDLFRTNLASISGTDTFLVSTRCSSDGQLSGWFVFQTRNDRQVSAPLASLAGRRLIRSARPIVKGTPSPVRPPAPEEFSRAVAMAYISGGNAWTPQMESQWG